MIKKIRHYYGAYQITAVAEVQLISMRREASVFSFTEKMRQQTESMLTLLCQEYPFFKYEIREAIVSTSISLFTYQSSCADKNILPHLQDWFVRLIQLLTQDGECMIMLQCNGRIGIHGCWQEFCILNKGTDVQYKITAETLQSLPERIRCSCYWRLGLTIILFFVLVCCLYDELAPQPPAGRLF